MYDTAADDTGGLLTVFWHHGTTNLGEPLRPDRVLAAVIISGLAPYDAEGLDWFAGIHPEGQAELRAATAGRAALARHLASAGFDPEMFTPADHEALDGRWAWLNDIAGRATAGGPDAMIDDDLASVGP